MPVGNYLARLTFAALITQPAMAADIASPPGKSCIMHVWASPTVSNQFFGIFLVGPFAGIEHEKFREELQRGQSNVTAQVSTRELLVSAVKESKLGTHFGITSDDWVVETDPSNIRSFIKSPTSPSDGCHYGFIFRMIQLQKSTAYGKRLFVYYTFVDRTTASQAQVKNGYNRENLKDFHPTDPDPVVATVLQDGVRRVVDDIVAKSFK